MIVRTVVTDKLHLGFTLPESHTCSKMTLALPAYVYTSLIDDWKSTEKRWHSGRPTVAFESLAFLSIVSRLLLFANNGYGC